MILLTGATGTIGRATTAALRAASAAFKVAARNLAQLHALGVPSVAFDWDQLSSYLPALQGVDRLFLLTPNSERQVGYILQPVAAAKRAGVRHIVRVSVMDADAEPGIILGHRYTYVDVSEQAAREAMEKAGMPAWLVDAFLELNTLIRQGHAATLASGVQQVLGRPPRSMREWAARLKTAPGTA